MILTASDGDSGPSIVDLAAGQKLSIDYVAIFESGSAEFQVLNKDDIAVWHTDIAKTADTKNIPVTTNLDAGQYKVIVRTHKLNNLTICWQGKAQ